MKAYEKCPFCGCEEIFVVYCEGGGVAGTCASCMSHGPLIAVDEVLGVDQAHDEAIDEWNRRYDES